MGNGASVDPTKAGPTLSNVADADGRNLRQACELHGGVESRAEAAFKTVDKDKSGGIDKDEFAAAARAVGLDLPEAELVAVFKQYDANRNGTIDQEEFLAFMQDKQTAFYDEDAAAVEKLSPDGLQSLIPYIGPTEASRGFRKAHLILKKHPAAAAAPLSATNAMRSLHLLLMLDAPLLPADDKKKDKGADKKNKAKEASQAIANQAAVPLIVAVCRADPASAQVRVKVSEAFPDGKLPLHLALEQRWPPEVVKALVQAYPEGAQTIDAVKMKKGAAVPGTIKAGRWARKIAEDLKLPDEVVKLLPAPKKKGSEVEWLDQAAIDAAPPAKGKK